jgi:molecular chaperone GrpE
MADEDIKTKQNNAENEAEVSAEQASDAAEEAVSQTESADASTAPDEMTELLRKLDEMTAEANAQRERYLRSVADLENFRKRALRDKDDARQRGAAAVLEDCIGVLDNLRLGLQAARQHEGAQVIVDGFGMVLNQFEGLLRNHGVEEIAPQGEAFDPNFHESVAHLPHPEVPDGHVSEVHRVGYRHKERLLRPAAVVVSKGPEEAATESTEG